MARATDTRRAVAGEVQIRSETDLTDEEYVTRKAWRDATAPACPFCPSGGCQLVSHETYPRQTPPGTRERRFRCRASGRTVSLLPDCLAARLRGSLAQVEQVVREAEQAPSREAAANALRPDSVTLPTALR